MRNEEAHVREARHRPQRPQRVDKVTRRNIAEQSSAL